MSEATHGVMTLSDTLNYANVAQTAIECAKVARALDSGEVVYGTARSVGDRNGNFIGSHDDVRDSYLRVTTSGGFEAFWPMSELADEISKGLFAAYDWTGLV